MQPPARAAGHRYLPLDRHPHPLAADLLRSARPARRRSLVRWPSTAAGVSAPPSTVWASASRAAASSALLRAACPARRAARCTTLLTVTATVTNSSSASRFRGSAIVKVCSGSVKYQFSSRLAVTAASTAGQKPPTTAMTTTATR